MVIFLLLVPMLFANNQGAQLFFQKAQNLDVWAVITPKLKVYSKIEQRTS